MDIFEFALNLEKNSENYYQELENSCPDLKLKKIFNLLKEEEIKHSKIIKSLKTNENLNNSDTSILKDAKEIFSQFTNEVSFDFSNDMIKQLNAAKELEQKSKKFYFEKAEEDDYAEHKIVLLKLVDEEEKHYFLLDNLIEFLSRPSNWVENAEFNHLDEY